MLFPDRDEMFDKYKDVLEKPMTEIKTLLKFQSGSLTNGHAMVRFLNTVFTKINGLSVEAVKAKRTKEKQHFEVVI